ncbi:tripartite tricarboxylate transporter substrate binding protein [Rubrivivax rivuli]|uniref:Tripartite tricarboxylate transporter substrate binding protein n=1 Tax=Rubrivivax rivuli TaxID=1862385 RepID=A0A437RAK0_9BURK|nr:tripartite tricarboxylate transporter substrate binding protein [Rubrivivax rivuli]RVU43717.1 tripartite tricarboxylate transporter substrate binding protein [Rubrivivax rivuli]
MTHRRWLLHTLAAGAAALAFPAARVAQAQPAFPTRPLTLMVPWPAGAPSDAIARKLQPGLQQALGQPVVVDNLGGAGGTLGVAKAMAQAADGHTLLVGTPTELVLSPLTIPAVRYKAEDFTLLAHFGRVPYVLCCRSTLPQKTLAEVLATKGQGGRPLSIGNIGPGSLIHLMSLQFEKTAGLTLTHVPYRGVPPMVQDVMGGQLDLAFVPLAGGTAAQLEQGKLRALGLSTVRPSVLLPQLPPLAAGHRSFEGFDFDVWGGVFARRETPPAVLQRLHQVLAATLSEPEFLTWARSTGSNPVPVLPLAEAQAFYPREAARYMALLRAFPDAVRN